MPDRYCPPSVQKLFQNYDRALKVEWAGDRWALKRKGRDGRYITLGYCRPDLLGDGKMWLSRLSAGDLWKQFGGSGTRAADEMDRQEREAETKRKLDRRDKFEQLGREEYAVLQRRCGERINNAGMPSAVALFLAIMLLPLSMAFGQQLTPTKIANLPSSGAVGMVRIISDGQTGNDCTVGGGTFTVLCAFDGSSIWRAPIDAGLFLRSCEDVLSDVCKVEERYSVIPVGGTDAPISTDQLYKSGPGYVRGIECYGTDSAAVAGTIALRDSTVAGSGAILWSRTILAADYSVQGVKAELQTPFSVGLFLDFTTTTDMSCIVRFR